MFLTMFVNKGREMMNDGGQHCLNAKYAKFVATADRVRNAHHTLLIFVNELID